MVVGCWCERKKNYPKQSRLFNKCSRAHSGGKLKGRHVRSWRKLTWGRDIGVRYRRTGLWSIGSRVDQGYPTLAPENLTTFAHFSVSSAINLPNSAGVIGIGSAPRPLIRALSCGSARPALILLLSLSMIAAEVPLGAPMPIQPFA